MTIANNEGPAGGLHFITLPMPVAILLCEAAYWPCILARAQEGRSEFPFGEGMSLDSRMALVHDRVRELTRLFGRAEASTYSATGNCLPEDFLGFLVSTAGGAP
jgi:hypothetical protein